MGQLKVLLIIAGFILTLASSKDSAIAHGDEAYAATARSQTQTPEQAVNSQMFQGYGSAIADCVKQVLGVAPSDIAKIKKASDLEMDTKKMVKLQDCMSEKGVNNHLGTSGVSQKIGKDIPGLDPSKAAEMKAMQAKLDAISQGQASKAASSQRPVMMMAPTLNVAPNVAPPPVAMPPEAAVPANTPEIPAPASAPTHKTPKKYWVTPE